MKHPDQVERWLDDLAATLDQAGDFVARGEHAFHADPALPLALEALSNRVSDLAKRLISADARRFSHPTWRLAARQRDFVAHHYDRLDSELLWRTATESFPELRTLVEDERGAPRSL